MALRFIALTLLLGLLREPSLSRVSAGPGVSEKVRRIAWRAVQPLWKNDIREAGLDARFQISHEVQIDRFVTPSGRPIVFALYRAGTIRNAVFGRLVMMTPRGKILRIFPPVDPLPGDALDGQLADAESFNKFRLVQLSRSRKAIALTSAWDGRYGKEGFVLLSADLPPKVLFQEDTAFLAANTIYFFDYDRDGFVDLLMDRVERQTDSGELTTHLVGYHAVDHGDRFVPIGEEEVARFKKAVRKYGRSRVPQFVQDGGTVAPVLPEQNSFYQ